MNDGIPSPTEPTRPLPRVEPVGPVEPTQRLASLPGPVVTPGAPSSSTPPRVGGRFSCRNLALGCGAGCLGMLLSLFVVLYGIYRWARETSTPVAPELLVDSNTAEFAALELDPSDPGVVDLLREVAARIDARSPETIPPPFRKLMSAFGCKDTRSVLGALLPVHLARAYRRPHGGDGDPGSELTAISLGRFANLVGYAFEHAPTPPGGRVVTHRGTRILVELRDAEVIRTHNREAGGGSGGLCPWGGTVNNKPSTCVLCNTGLKAENPDEMKHSLDLLAGADVFLGGSPLLLDLHERLGKDRVAWGFTVNRDGTLPHFHPELDELSRNTPHVKHLEGASWELSLASADRARGRLHLRMTGPEAATGFARYLADIDRELRLSVKREHGVELTWSTKADGRWVEVEFGLEGLREALVSAFVPGK
ncbi:MAG: hypothetical protein HYZ53_07920 [Planctomycetes bacterium]|nr:hypothetical protein [Planctomycetota bacterium]